MPDPRKPRQTERGVIPLLRDAAPLIMLASALFYTNRWLALTSDETSTLNAAAQNVTTILASFRSSTANAPLYQLLLHFWLRITGGAFDWLRAPEIISFTVGLWLLSRLARQLGGEESSNAVAWLGALWPFGFHQGRLAGPHAFAFLVIAALTFQYFRSVRSQQRSDWVIFCLLAVGLLYTAYFGWALLLLLAIAYSWRIGRIDHSQSGPAVSLQQRLTTIAATAAVLVVAFAPRWSAFIGMVESYQGWPRSFRFMVFNAAYNFYLLFVSQSIAPWFWKLSLPAAVGALVLIILVFVGIRGEALRFLIFAALLFALMALAGILEPHRLLLIGPWFLFPIAVALGTIDKWQWRIPMALALAAIAVIGWYGILNRRYYAEPQFFEPWPSLAQEAADARRGGAIVMSNDNTFFFYLTYALKPSAPNTGWRFTGALPTQIQYPSVWDPRQWQEAGRPTASTVLWIRGSSNQGQLAAMDRAGDWLGNQCGDRLTRYLARDSGYGWKQRFVPNFSGAPWLIEIRQYLCRQNAAFPADAGTTPKNRH